MSDTHTYKILAVSKNAVFLDSLTSDLKKAGYGVLNSFNEAEALKFLKQTPIDLVIGDTVSAETDSIELCRKLRSDAELNSVPLIICGAPEKADAALEAKANLFLEIPFEPLNLIAKAAQIIERSRVNKTLKSNENRFQSLIENATDTIGIIASDGTILYESPSVENLLGYKPEELVGKMAFDLIHPEDRAKITEHFNQSLRKFVSISPTEYRVRNKNNEWQPIESVGKPFNDPINGLVFITNSRNISERKQSEDALRRSEERFKLVSRATNDALWDWDLVTDSLWMNEVHCNLLGYSSEEINPVIETWYKKIHPDDFPKVTEGIHKVIQSGKNYWSDEYRLLSKTGKISYVFDRGYVVYNEKGIPIRMIGAAIDITERKLAEQALQINDDRLQKHNDVLNNLAKHQKLSKDSVQESIREITEIAAQTLETSRVSVWLYNQDKSKIKALDLYELNSDSHSDGFELAESDYPKYFKSLGKEETIAAHDAHKDKRTKEFTESYLVPLGITSMLDVPIRVSGKVIGVVCHEHQGEMREWKLDEQNFAGSVAAIIAVIVEGYERRQAEEALRRSQEQFSSLIDSIEGIVWEADAKTFECKFISQQAERLLGYPIENWLNIPNFRIDHIYPEDRERVMETCYESARKLENFELEYRMIAADGRIVWLHDIVKVDDSNPDAVRLRGVIVDITRSKENETAIAEANKRAIQEYARLLERLATLGQKLGAARDLRAIYNAVLKFSYDSVPCSALFISLYDSEHNTRKSVYMWYNGNEKDVSNLEPFPVGAGPVGQAIKKEEVIIIDNYLDLVDKKPANIYLGYDEDSREPQSTVIAPMKIKGKIVGVIEVQSYELAAYTQEHASAMHMAANLVANAIENVQLLEQEKLSSEQLRQSQKLESVGRLAGGIAHDFNNMLTAINGYTDLTLRRLKSDDSLRRNLEEIKKAGERSAMLTQQLLAFSRQQILQPKILDINEIVLDTGKMLQRLISEDITLKLIPNSESKFIKADPGQFAQVIMNLAVNARDAMPKGGNLTIETADVFLDEKFAAIHLPIRSGKYIMLAISDTGTGISDEILEHIFEPFYTTKETGKGTGLGLAMVYGIVKQSGGYIWVDSQIGKGSVFKIYLPLVDKAAKLAESVNRSEEVPNGTETILLVEDEEIVRNMSRQILETCGYKVIEAHNGLEALSVCKETKCKIDLVLTDVVMPKMSGRQLAEKLKFFCPEVKVLYMSGYADDEIVRQGLVQTGANFIQKPFTFNAIARKIRELLEMKINKQAV